MKKHIDVILILLFVGSVYVSALIVNDSWQNTGKLYGFGLLVTLYFGLRLLLGTGKRVIENVVCLLVVLAGLFEAVLGLLQIYGFQVSQHSFFRLTGTFFNPGPYAGFLAVVAPISLFFTLTAKKTEKLSSVKKSVGIITLFTVLLVLPAAMSRAAWMATITGCLIVTYKHYVEKWHILELYQNRRKTVLIVGLGLIIAVVVSLAGIYLLKKDSADGRLLTWKICIKTAIKHPMGVGLGNFSGIYGEEQAAYFASGRANETEEYVAGNPEYAFNEYLQIAVESGVVSLLLFLAFICVAMLSLLKRHTGMAGAMAALLVFSCFSYPLSLWEFGVIISVLLAAAQPQNTQGFTKELKRIICFGVFLICIGSLLLVRQYPVYKAYKKWNKSQFFYHAELYKEVVKTYKPLYPYLKDRVEFLFEYGRSLGIEEYFEESNRVLQRATEISCDPMLYNLMGCNYQSLKNYEQAEAYMLKSTHIVPNRLYPWYLLMKLYDKTRQKDKAIEAANIVLIKEPKVQSKAIEEMREEAREVKDRNHKVQ